MSQLIAEILEKDATGEIAKTYDEIRIQFAVPNVTTIVRHVATIAGCLQWYWATLKPAVECGDFQETANALSETLAAEPFPPLPELALRAMGVDEDAERQINDVYEAYNRNNRPNILFVCTLKRLLRDGVGGTGPYVSQRTGWQPPSALPPLVPMVQADEMAPEILQLAQAIGSWGFPAGTGFLPGVYRHLVNWPSYMAYAGAMFWPRLESGEVAHAGAAMVDAAEAAADRLVAALPAPAGDFAPPDAAAADALVKVLDSLTPKIPEMIIVCKLLGDALPSNRKD